MLNNQHGASHRAGTVVSPYRPSGARILPSHERGGMRTPPATSVKLLLQRRQSCRPPASAANSSSASSSVYQDYYLDTSMVFNGVQGIHHPDHEQYAQHQPAPVPAAETMSPVQSNPSIWGSITEILKMSLPLTLTNVSGFTLNCFSDAMIGRLGASALGTTTLANSFYGMMGISIIWGGAAGMETLAGQAFGAGQTRMMRLVLLRAMVVCWALCLPIALLWQHAEWIMVKLGQSATMAAQGAVYLQALVPSLFVYVLAECLQSYLVCQNNVQPATLAKGITAALGPVFYYVLMFKMHLGLQGAAYAYALCKLTNALLLIGWMWWNGDASPPPSSAQANGSSSSSSSTSGKDQALPAAASSTSFEHIQGNGAGIDSTHGAILEGSSNGMQGVTTDKAQSDGNPLQKAADSSSSSNGVSSSMSDAGLAGSLPAVAAAAAVSVSGITVLPDVSLAEVLDLKGAWEYIKFGVPSAMMTMLEWWAYEINVLLAGTLPNAEVAVAVLGICLAISGWVYMFPQSISTSTCARISNALGGGDARSARSYFWAAMLMVACSQACLATGILLGARHLVNFFCQDPAVMVIALGIVPIVACNTFADGMNVVLNGVLRACGRQALGARLQLCSYWLVGVPLSWFLGVRQHLGIAGFLIAIGLTSFTQAIVCGSIISRFNWQHEVKRSQQILSDMSATMSVDGPSKEQ